MCRAFVILLLAAFVVAPVGVGAALAPGGTATVTEIVDGDTVLLADGREVRLVGIQAPKLPLGRSNFEAWPLAEESKTALAAMTRGRRVTLSYGGRRTDRHGRRLAHLHLIGAPDDGLWVQGALLSRGMARVYSFFDNRALVAEMLARERSARVAHRGIWDHPYYRILNPAESVRFIGSFQLVEGRVRRVAKVRGRTYLNFGDDWRQDFTISVSAKARRMFDRSDTGLETLEGQAVRVRGWLKSLNGPMIDASHPEQIEVLRR